MVVLRSILRVLEMVFYMVYIPDTYPPLSHLEKEWSFRRCAFLCP